MKKIGDFVSPNDPELVQKTLARLDEQDRWNDVFSTKLIEILDKSDALRSELRQILLKATTDLAEAKKALIDTKYINTQINTLYQRTMNAAILIAGVFVIGILWLDFVLKNAVQLWMPITGTVLVGMVFGLFLRRNR